MSLHTNSSFIGCIQTLHTILQIAPESPPTERRLSTGVLRVVELLEMGFRFWRKNEVDELCNDVNWKWYRIRVQLEFGTVSQPRATLSPRRSFANSGLVTAPQSLVRNSLVNQGMDRRLSHIDISDDQISQ